MPRRRRLAVGAAVLLTTGLLLGTGAVLVGPPERPAAGATAAPPGTLVARDVRYTRDLRLDIYTPPYAGTGRTVAVLIHGCCGDRGDLVKLAETVAAAGGVVFNVDWGGMGAGQRFPESFEDVGCAVRFARRHAERYGGDPRRVVLAGWSDGAMAAATVAFADEVAPPHRCLEPAGSARPDAVVGLAGFYGWELPVDERYVTPRAERFLGGSPASAPSAWREATPYAWLDPAPRVPVTVVVGAEDVLRPDGERFVRAVRATGTPARLVVVPAAGEPTLLSPRTSEGRTAAAEILRARAGAHPAPR